MKIISKTTDSVTYRFEHKEWLYFVDLLRLFPVLKEDYYQAGTVRNDPKLADTHQLLKEMLSDYKAEQKLWLLKFLKSEENRVKKKDGSIQLALSMREKETLLEILNDIRVGSWMVLGSPGLKDADLELKLNHAKELQQVAWAMDLSGYFQMGFLRSENSP